MVKFSDLEPHELLRYHKKLMMNLRDEVMVNFAVVYQRRNRMSPDALDNVADVVVLARNDIEGIAVRETEKGTKMDVRYLAYLRHAVSQHNQLIDYCRGRASSLRELARIDDEYEQLSLALVPRTLIGGTDND